MCHSKVKMGGSRVSLSVKMRGSGASSSVKVGVSGTDFEGRVWCCLNALRSAGCSKPAVGGNEWLERKEIWKMMVFGMAKKKLQW